MGVAIWVMIITLMIRIGTYEVAALLDIDPANLALAICAAAALRILNLWAWLRFAGMFIAQDAGDAGRIVESNVASTRLEKFPWFTHAPQTNKWFRRVATLGEAVLLVSLANAHTGYMIRSAGPAPNFELVALDGETVPLEKFRGEPAILYFWAPWCGPCKFQVMALKELQEQNPDVQILSIACDYATEDSVREYAEANGLAFDVVLGGPMVQAQYGVGAYPTTFVLDGEGQIRFANKGVRNAKELQAQLAEAGVNP